MNTQKTALLPLQGTVAPGFEAVRREFARNFSEHAFGEPAAGGSLAFADPDAQVGYACVMNWYGYAMQDDPREKALRDTFYHCLHERQEFRV